jgi:hypothetical protein
MIMTQEDKELLLKDLCARVPYHPKGHVVNACNGAECDAWLTCATFPMFTNIINNCRLYLRPMSSMTREEGNELFQLMGNGCDSQRVDFYNSHYLDCRGLIEKGLALEAPEEMYKT